MIGNLQIDRANGTTTTQGSSAIAIGNNIPNGTDKNSRGYVELYGTSAYYARLRAGALTENRNIDFPNKAGTVALIEDIRELTVSVDSTVSNVLTVQQGSIYYIGTGATKILVASIQFTTSAQINQWIHLFPNLPSRYSNCRVTDDSGNQYQYQKSGYIQTTEPGLAAGSYILSFVLAVN